MKVVIYTAIFGSKDEVPKHESQSSDCDFDFVCVTDDKSLKSDVYKIIYVEREYRDITYNARKVKIMGFTGIEEYDVAIWHDANIQLNLYELNLLVEKLSPRFAAYFIKHPLSSCVYEEIAACLRLEKDYPHRLVKFTRYLKKINFPKNHNLFATGLYIKNMNNAHTSELELEWWKLLKKFTRRDQLALPVILYSCDIPYKTLDFHIRETDVLKIKKHLYPTYKNNLTFIEKVLVNRYTLKLAKKYLSRLK